MHPLDGIGINIRGDHLDCRRQVDDQRVFGRRRHDFRDRIADFLGKIQLGTGEGFRGVFPAPVGVWVILRDGFDQLCGLGCQRLDCRAVFPEDDAALQLRRGVIKVHDDVFRALTGLKGPPDQVLTSLHQHLDGDVVRN